MTMLIGGHIWAELGELAIAVERIDHETGNVVFRSNATQEQRDAVQLVIANHNPNAVPPPNVRAQILDVSQQALASGFLHVMMFDLMQRYLAQAQAIVPTVTEADLLDVNGPYYSKPYADTRVYYLQLVALQDAK